MITKHLEVGLHYVVGVLPPQALFLQLLQATSGGVSGLPSSLAEVLHSQACHGKPCTLLAWHTDSVCVHVVHRSHQVWGSPYKC